MRFIVCLLSPLLFSTYSLAETFSISCGELQGYSYYFEAGYVGKSKSLSSGFTTDGYSGGHTTLSVDDKNNGKVSWRDSSGAEKSAVSTGGVVTVLRAGENGLNWFIQYSGGLLEVYSFNILSKQVAMYVNNVGSDIFPKNSILVGDCKII